MHSIYHIHILHLKISIIASSNIKIWIKYISLLVHVQFYIDICIL